MKSRCGSELKMSARSTLCVSNSKCFTVTLHPPRPLGAVFARRRLFIHDVISGLLISYKDPSFSVDYVYVWFVRRPVFNVYALSFHARICVYTQTQTRAQKKNQRVHKKYWTAHESDIRQLSTEKKNLRRRPIPSLKYRRHFQNAPNWLCVKCPLRCSLESVNRLVAVWVQISK